MFFFQPELSPCTLPTQLKKTIKKLFLPPLFSNFSSYLKYMLGVDIKTNGFLSALPYLCRYLGGILHGRVSDTLYKRRLLRLVTIRRIFNSISKASLFPLIYHYNQI